jgi:hypothetical protein
MQVKWLLEQGTKSRGGRQAKQMGHSISSSLASSSSLGVLGEMDAVDADDEVDDDEEEGGLSPSLGDRFGRRL